MLKDMNGRELKDIVHSILKNLERNSIDIEIKEEFEKPLLTSFFIFYKIGLGTHEYQEKIARNEFPNGYEIISAYMLDRFLTKYFRNIDQAKKILYLKTVEKYPQKKFNVSGNGVKYLPRETSFLEEAIQIVEVLTSKFLGINPLCRLIMIKKWRKDVFIRWYTRTLSSESGSLYSKEKKSIESSLERLLNYIMEIEASI